MKKITSYCSKHLLKMMLVFCIYGSLTLNTFAQTCPPADLIISEYVEGSFTNKCLEIFNGTGAAVNLDGYSIYIYSNGATSPTEWIVLTGMLADGDVHVSCDGGSDQVLLDLADQTGFSAFSGDDAVAIAKNGVPIDIFGNIGCDPGSDWVDGDVETRNHTLVRMPTVTDGITVDPADSPCDFPTLGTEWMLLELDDYSNLGMHTFTACDAPATCDVPMNVTAAVLSGNAVRLAWDAAANAERYRIRYRVPGTTWTEVLTAGTETFRFLNALTLNTDYEYQIKTLCASGNSVWSPTYTFVTTGDVCDFPESATSFGITATGASVDWPADAADDKYKFKYRSAGSPWTEIIITPNTTTITGLMASTNYKYKIKTKCAGGWTQWGAKYEFTTAASFVANNRLASNDLQLYPNPASDQLTLDFGKEIEGTIQIMNANGRQVRSINISGFNQTIDVSDLTTGFYFLSINTENNQLIEKFIKQ